MPSCQKMLPERENIESLSVPDMNVMCLNKMNLLLSRNVQVVTKEAGNISKEMETSEGVSLSIEDKEQIV